jgi:hypothetical protein
MTDLSQQYTSDKKDHHGSNQPLDFFDDDANVEHRLLPCRCCCVVWDPDRQQQLRWWLLGTSTISMIFSFVAVADCSFLILDYGESNNIFNPHQLGLFNMAVFDEGGNPYGCVPQNGDDRFKDGAFGAGRAFGVMTALLETLLFLVTAWVLLVMRPNWAVQGWKSLQFLSLLALCCQLLMFATFGSSVCKVVEEDTFGSDQPIPSDCGPGAASTMAALNVIVLIGLTVLVCIVPAPIHPYFIRWSDDDDDIGMDDQVDDLLGEREIGNRNKRWKSDDDVVFPDDSNVHNHADKAYSDVIEVAPNDDKEPPRRPKKNKNEKKNIEAEGGQEKGVITV